MDDKDCISNKQDVSIEDVVIEDVSIEDVAEEGVHIHELYTPLVDECSRFWGEEGKEMANDMIKSWADAFNNLNNCIASFFEILNRVEEEHKEREASLSKKEYRDFMTIPHEAFDLLVLYDPMVKEWISDEESKNILEVLRKKHKERQETREEYN